MKIRIIHCLLFLLMACMCFAQKKEISNARDWVKRNNNLDRAEQSMLGLLKDSANRQNDKIWDVLFESLHKQYQQGNEKLYLNQQYDTVSLFNIASRMFKVMAEYDSIDARPDKKGRIRLEYRKNNAALLNTLRPNLFNGGVFLIQKQKYSEAYNLLNQYINTAYQPLFESYQYGTKDKKMPVASYWAMYCGYKMKDSAKVLLHAPLAIKDEAHHELVLQYLSETYELMGWKKDYLATLKSGFDSYPLSSFFYSHLIEFYTQEKQWGDALALTDRALRQDSTSILFHLAKSTILLNMGEYKESFAISDSLLQANDSLPEANLNAGLAKYNEGVTLDKEVRLTGKQKKSILKSYREALPYLEKFRAMRPERIDAWGLPLYTIYLTLNMGKEFDEIDGLMKKK